MLRRDTTTEILMHGLKAQVRCQPHERLIYYRTAVIFASCQNCTLCCNCQISPGAFTQMIGALIMGAAAEHVCRTAGCIACCAVKKVFEFETAS